MLASDNHRTCNLSWGYSSVVNMMSPITPPYVDGAYKLQPCFYISIHAVIEAGLNAQVQKPEISIKQYFLDVYITAVGVLLESFLTNTSVC